MSPEERLKIVQKNHVCFSCLKNAGREHRASNCTDESSAFWTVTSASIIVMSLASSKSSSIFGCRVSRNNTEAMLPGITIEMTRKDKRFTGLKSTNRSDLHKDKTLGLKGRQIDNQ